MKKLFLVLILSAGQIVPLTLAALEPQEIEQITSEQEQILAIMIGLNRWCIQLAAQLPSHQIKVMVAAVKELMDNNQFKTLLSLYKQCVNSFYKQEESLILIADELFLPNELELLIQGSIERGLCTADGIFSAQTRDLFLACYLPFPETVEEQ